MFVCLKGWWNLPPEVPGLVAAVLHGGEGEGPGIERGVEADKRDSAVDFRFQVFGRDQR